MKEAVIPQPWAVTPPVHPAALRRQRDSCIEEYLRQRDRGADETVIAALQAEIDRCDALLAELTAAQQGTSSRGTGGDGAGDGAGVGLGSAVTIRWDDGDEVTYTIVGSLAVDPSTHRISYESPVGRALLGRRAGEWIEVATPARGQRLLVVAIGDGSVSPPTGAPPAPGR